MRCAGGTLGPRADRSGMTTGIAEARGLPLWAAVALLAFAACDPSTRADAGDAIVRDSAGVRIVQNSAPAWGEGEAWSLSQEPVLEIGVLEGEVPYMFSGIRGVRRLADGSIALLDGGSFEIRIFNADGRHVRSMGRQGEGPGEFQFPAGLETIGDSIVVWDARTRRGSMYSVDGELVRTFGLDDSRDEIRFPDLRGVFPDGDLLAAASPPIDGRVRTGPRWSTDLLVRYSPDGLAPTVLGEVETVQCDPARDGECAFLAYGALGGFLLQGDRIHVSRPDRNEVRVFDGDGELVSRFHGAAAPQPVTEAMKDEFRAAVVAGGDPSRAAERREYVSRASFADVVPAFLDFRVATDGHVWVREYRVEDAPFGYFPAFPPRDDPYRWTVYAPDGILLGDIEIPMDFEIGEIGPDHVLGVHRDELDVQRVRMYELVKP